MLRFELGFLPGFVYMEATYRHAIYCGCLCAVLFVVPSIALHSRTAQQEDLYRTVSQQFISYDLNGALDGAKKAWLADPDSEVGWRFKLKYAQVALFLRRLDEVATTLQSPPPVQFSQLRPRYNLLKALLGLYKGDTTAPHAVLAAIAEARAKADHETEAEGWIFLQAENKTGKSDGQVVLKRVIEIAHQNHLDYQEARALNNLGSLVLLRSEYAKAIEYFQQSIAHSKRVKAYYVQAAATQNLGECYLHLGDFGRALSSLEDAVKLLPPNNHSAVLVNAKNDIGAYYSLRRENSAALRYYREAFALAQFANETSNRYILSSLNLATGLLQVQAVDEAEQFNELAGNASQKALHAKIEIEPEWIAAIEMNRANIAAGRGKWDSAVKAYRMALDILKKVPPNQTQVLAYAGLAEAEERLHNTAQARSNFENALNSIELNRARQLSAQYQIKFLSALIQFYQQYEEFLMRQHEPWAALAVADSSRAGVLTQSMTSSRQQAGFEGRILAKARETNTAFLFYSLSPQKAYVWALTPGGKDFRELKLSGTEIEREVNRYSALIQARRDTLAENNPGGRRLYETLIGPVASHLQPGMRVVVVPDGVLHSLNFETLLVDDRKPHYWLQDVSLAVAPCLRILLDGSKRKAMLSRALVIGDPLYSGTDYSQLPESKKEIAQVGERFPKGLTLLSQRQAVPEAYQRAQPELFSLIHFSAHVDADPQSPLESAIILSPGEDGSRKLYARDFKKLTADLVTVSGCSSVGKTALSGEGMVGFAWAAFDAGARNAVTSLWAVDDLSTSDLMGSFYKGVTEGKPYATALRDAKLQMLRTRQFSKPVYWAPFQLYSRNIGDGGRLTLH